MPPQTAPLPGQPPMPAAQPGAEAPIAPPQDSGRNLLAQLGISGPALERLDAARGRSAAATDVATAQVLANQERYGELTAPPAPRPTPPTLQEIAPPPEAEPTDPLRVFGQVLPVLAMLGGAFVRNNATAALRAGAAAMQAAEENDAEALERAHQQWEDSIAAITSNNATRLQQYQAIIDDRNLSMEERMAQLQALAASEQNALRLQQLASGEVTQLSEGIMLEMRASEILTNAFLQQQRINAARGQGSAQMAARMAAQAQTNANVLTQIARARDLATNNNVTGWGSLVSGVPGPAGDLAATLDTIVANIGFDRLQEMRNNSPTGGALGSVTENELRMLQSVIASLRQSQSRDQFLTNLGIVEAQYQRSMANIAAAYQQDYGVAPPPDLAAPSSEANPFADASDDDILAQLRERGLMNNTD